MYYINSSYTDNTFASEEGNVNIQITNASNDPIYLQIKNQIKSAIISGKMKAGEQLPSIRYLAKELRVSVITTKRAYDELEIEGFINSVQGKGSFVSVQNSEVVFAKIPSSFL